MAGVFRIGVVSDTHGTFHPRLARALEGVNLILHAGDIGGGEILERLSEIAPVRAVAGNVDPAPTEEIPIRLELVTPIARIGMTHGHRAEAPSTNRARMVRWFAAFEPDIIVYGHSHIPMLEWVEGVRVFNPGSAGRGRFGQRPTIGLIHGSVPGAAGPVQGATGRKAGGSRGAKEEGRGGLILEHVALEAPGAGR